MRKRLIFIAFGLAWACLVTAQPQRNFAIADALALKKISDPQVSPDGRWIAYVVSSIDLEEDSDSSDIYMIPFAGGEPITLTRSKESDSRPRWSPDGRYLGFLSSRENDNDQIWLLDRRGREAFPISNGLLMARKFFWYPRIRIPMRRKPTTRVRRRRNHPLSLPGFNLNGMRSVIWMIVALTFTFWI